MVVKLESVDKLAPGHAMTLSICDESALGLKSAAAPIKDRQTVSPEAEPISQRISEVIIHRKPLQEDDRGELIEIYSPEWGLHSQPLVYAYFVSICAGQITGWVLHKLQDDRLFFQRGAIRVALFDERPIRRRTTCSMFLSWVNGIGAWSLFLKESSMLSRT